VFREAAAICRAEASTLLPVAVAAMVVPTGIAALTVTHASEAVASVIDTSVTTAATVAFAGVAKESVRRRHAGEARASLGMLIRSVRPVFLRLVAVAVLTALGVTVGLLALLIPGLVLATWWAVASAVVAVEHTTVWRAFGRSRALVRGNAPRVFAVLALNFLAVVVTAGLTAVIFLLVGIGRDPDVELEIGEALVLPVEGLAVPLMYFALVEIAQARRPLASSSG
jgi:hypothetical protein